MAIQQQVSRINDVLFEIHRDISADLNAAKLARIAAYSEQHFHRVFQRVVGETVNYYIRRTRLEQAANQLTFDRHSTVLEIAEKCGFSSLSSFSHSFKKAFGATPGQWRVVEKHNGKPSYLDDPDIAAGYRRVQSAPLPVPELVQLPPRLVAYVRHQGYGRSIRVAWQTLRAWTVSVDCAFDMQLGLHHSNPAWVPLQQCRYVACVAIDKPLLRRGIVNTMTIPGGLHAAFQLSGRYGELLPYLSMILEQWLPSSHLTMQTTPAFVHYQKNHFLRADEQFDLTFYLPVSI